MKLPAAAIKEDRKLEKQADTASEALAQHRWHWTLDETNPKRISLNQYAKDVGRARSVIQSMVKGYQSWITAGLSGQAATTLSESINRASMSTEKAEVIDAISEATGRAFRTVKDSDAAEVRRVRALAQDAAERKGTTVAEEARTIAQLSQKEKTGELKRKQERKQRLDFRYIEIEKAMLEAQRKLLKALEVAHDVNFDQEHVNLLQQAVSNVRAVLDLIDLAFAGAVDIDWDAELATLKEEINE